MASEGYKLSEYAFLQVFWNVWINKKHDVDCTFLLLNRH